MPSQGVIQFESQLFSMFGLLFLLIAGAWGAAGDVEAVTVKKADGQDDTGADGCVTISKETADSKKFYCNTLDNAYKKSEDMTKREIGIDETTDLKNAGIKAAITATVTVTGTSTTNAKATISSSTAAKLDAPVITVNFPDPAANVVATFSKIAFTLQTSAADDAQIDQSIFKVGTAPGGIRSNDNEKLTLSLNGVTFGYKDASTAPAKSSIAAPVIDALYGILELKGCSFTGIVMKQDPLLSINPEKDAFTMTVGDSVNTFSNIERKKGNGAVLSIPAKAKVAITNAEFNGCQ